SSIRSKTSGNICAATNSRSPSSTTTTTSLIKPATHGTSLNKIQSASRQSPHEHGQQSIIRAVGISCASQQKVCPQQRKNRQGTSAMAHRGLIWGAGESGHRISLFVQRYKSASAR